MIGADVLVLLSDVDGLYTANPNGDNSATHIREIAQITPDIMAMAGPANAAYASGGMVTKLEAARIATSAGCQMIICNGQSPAPLSRLEAGAKCTIFAATLSPHTARKQWIAGALTPKGTIRIDDGAARALRAGRSLLPAGVIAVNGQFERGDLIEIEDSAGLVIGHGLSSYGHKDAMAIRGHKSNEIESVLGYRERDEMIHADNLVMSDG
jgi:glutamate 5-kinase